MPLIYCAVPDATLVKDRSQPFNPFRDRIDPTRWFSSYGKFALSAAISSLNPNLPGNHHDKNILNRLDVALKKVASTFDSGNAASKNKNFAPLLAHANIFCLMLSDACYSRLQKSVADDLFVVDPAEFKIIGVYQAPATGRIVDNLPMIIENSSADASLSAEFLKTCTQAIEESRPTLAGIFKDEQHKYVSKNIFLLDNKLPPQASLASAPVQNTNKQDSEDSTTIINNIKTKLCNELDKEMKALLQRSNVSSVNQLDEARQERYKRIGKLHNDIGTIADACINEFSRNGWSYWETTYHRRLTGAIQVTLSHNAIDKYNSLEKIGIGLLNLVTILFSPVKRAVTGTWFFSLEGKTKEAVREVQQMANEIKSPKV